MHYLVSLLLLTLLAHHFGELILKVRVAGPLNFLDLVIDTAGVVYAVPHKPTTSPPQNNRADRGIAVPRGDV